MDTFITRLIFQLCITLATMTIKSQTVPVIDWSTFDVSYPVEAASTGVEIYDNTVYGIGGKHSRSVYRIDIDDLVNGIDNWHEYEWKNDSTYVSTYGEWLGYLRVTSTTAIDNLIYFGFMDLDYDMGFGVMLIYNMTSNTQISMNLYDFSFPEPAAGACFVNNGTHIFALGGYSNDVSFTVRARTRIYDINGDRWILAASMNTKRCLFSCNYDGYTNTIWAFSGRTTYNGGTVTKVFEYYKISEDKWYRLSDSDSRLTFAHDFHTSIQWNINDMNLFYINEYGLDELNLMYIFGAYDNDDTDYYTEIVSINTTILNKTYELDYTTIGSLSNLDILPNTSDTLGAIQSGYFSSSYDIVNQSYYYVGNGNEWIQHTVLQRTIVVIGGMMGTLSIQGIKTIWKGVITYNHSIKLINNLTEYADIGL